MTVTSAYVRAWPHAATCSLAWALIQQKHATCHTHIHAHTYVLAFIYVCVCETL